MMHIRIKAGEFEFGAILEQDVAPKTCSTFLGLLPYKQQIVHVRWSGEACWIPLGDKDFALPFENATSYPAPGQVILYPGGFSETELLIAYGGVSFASKLGPLAGNHFMTITTGLENLFTLGTTTLWKGAQDILFERG